MNLTGLARGFLLPEDVLTSGWFILLAAIVGFNTLIYLGLTLAKFFPMPKQIHPRRVRGWLHRLGRNLETRSAMADIPVPRQPETTDAYEAMRLDISRRDIPQAFSLTGGLLILVSLASTLAATAGSLPLRLAAVGLGMVFLLLAQWLGRRRFRGMTMRIVWAVACCIVVGALLAEGLTQGVQLIRLPIAYAVIVMTAFAPVTLSWRVSFGGSAVMLGGLTAAGLVLVGADALPLMLLGLTALLVGATLLRLRLVAIDALSREAARAKSLASTDVLTGVLTRQGFLRLLPALAANAERHGGQLCLMYFDIDSLSTANTQYGVQYGDDVIRTVATTIDEQVRRGDVLARWDGDEFLVAGIGSRPDAEQLAARVQDAVRRTGLALGKWPITITVGTAAGDPAKVTFDELARSAVRDAREHEAHLGPGSTGEPIPVASSGTQATGTLPTLPPSRESSDQAFRR